MTVFDRFVSDTTAGSANQTTFESDNEWHTGRVYYTLFAGGSMYTLLFSDMVDSTFDDGSRSVCNETCSGWEVSHMRVGLCKRSSMDVAVEPPIWSTLTVGGKREKRVAAGERFESDPVLLNAGAGDVLCAEYRFRGSKLPCHKELWIASFVKDGDRFMPSVALPVPSMIGVQREVVQRVGFLGDSITQGIGSMPNAYRHWAAQTANALGDRYAFWNLGIGFARSGDAASDGAWLAKAKQNDVIVLCLGVNDLLYGIVPDVICENLRTVVALLTARNCRVFVQTVPPFEGLGDERERVNEYIRNVLVCDGVFDTSFLAAADGMPLFGGHPNDEGCRLWSERLTAYLRERL